MNFGLLKLDRGDTDAALIFMQKALAAPNGSKPMIWNNVGAVHLRRGEIEDGVKAFQRALELQPCRFDARMNLVRTLEFLGDYQGGKAAREIPRGCHLTPEQMAALAAQ